MNKIDSKSSGRLTLLCAFAYFTSYLTRINFAAVMASMIQQGDIDKTSAGAVTTLGFITYGVGQLISGWLGDRINPKKLMFAGFLLTAGMNMLIPVCPNGSFMCVVWSVNGFAQSFMWPPMVKIMKTAMDTDRYNKAVVRVSFGSTLGTIMIYLISPLIIRLWNWQAVFIINGTIAVIVSAVWLIAISRIEKKAEISYVLVKRNAQKKKQKKSLGVNPLLLILVMLAIMFQGALRDGVTTWVPTFITEVFNIDSSNSILTSVIIPVFGLASLQLSSIIYYKMGKKPYKTSAVFFVFSAVCAIVLRFFTDVSPVVTVIFAAMIVAVMHGINLVLVCFLPAILGTEDNVSVLSGLLNFTTYVGSALSTYGFAVFSEKTGWEGTVTLWAVIAAAGVLMCVLCGTINKKRSSD